MVTHCVNGTVYFIHMVSDVSPFIVVKEVSLYQRIGFCGQGLKLIFFENNS